MLLLTTPAQHAADNPAVELEPRRLRQWLAVLPTLNVLETVRRLQRVLTPFNELALDDDRRLRLLEIYRESLESILFEYDDLRLRQLAIPADQRHAVAQDIMWLYLELANGYKIVLRNQHEAGRTLRRHGPMLLAAFRAAEAMGQAVLYAYRAHEPVPPLVLLELHQIYHLACAHQARVQKVRAARGEYRRPTLQALYQRLLLILAADGGGLAGNELFETWLLLEEFCGDDFLCRGETPAVGWVVNWMEDAPPQVLEAAPAADTRWVFDLAPVMEHMEQWCREREAEAAGAALGRQEVRLLRRLLRALERGGAPETGAAGRAVRLLVGLPRLARALGDPRWLEEAATVEVHAGIEVRAVGADGESPFADGDWVLHTLAGGRCRLQAGGAGLPPGCGPGQLVGLLDVSAGEPVLTVALVEEAAHDDGGGVRLEASLLDGPPTAVRLHGAGREQWGLYLPRDPASRRPATLLVERTLHLNGQALEVDVGGQTYRVRPADTIAETPAIRRFSFSIVRE